MAHTILDGVPIEIPVVLNNNVEKVFTLDSSNYPVVGGVSALLANKTIRLSAIWMYLGAAPGEILEYIKIDDWIICGVPFQNGHPLVTTSWYNFSIKEWFGRDYLAVRNTIKVKLSAAPAGTAVYYFHGIATDERTE